MKHLEDQLQAACVTWFRYQYPDVVIMAIPNGGKRNAREAARMKKTGTLAGVADLFVMKAKHDWDNYPDGCKYKMTVSNGLFIELKVAKNKMTESQKRFEEQTFLAKYDYVVCRSIDEFMNVCNEYLK